MNCSALILFKTFLSEMAYFQAVDQYITKSGCPCRKQSNIQNLENLPLWFSHWDSLWKPQLFFNLQNHTYGMLCPIYSHGDYLVSSTLEDYPSF